MVELNQQIYITLGVILASCIGTKNPSLHDGLRLEVINDLLGYCLISHHPNWSLSACKDSKRIWNGKEKPGIFACLGIFAMYIISPIYHLTQQA